MTIEVNGEPVLPEAIRLEMKRLQAPTGVSAETLTVDERIRLREAAVDSLIDRMLFYQEAHRLGIAPGPADISAACAQFAPRMDGVSGCRAGVDLDTLMNGVERQLVADRLAEYWSRTIKPPRQSEISDFYRKNQERFWAAEMVWASHVARYTEGRNAEQERLMVEQMRERLRSQESFAAVAQQYSDCPENAGDLGYFPRGVMVEEFDAVVFTAPLNELTPVFETRFGFHVALIRDRKKEGIQPLNEVAPAVTQMLLLQKKDSEIGIRLDALRGRANIQGLAR